MSKSIGRVFGTGAISPYGYETDYMQYLRGYNPYNYEQTLQNMMPSAVNVNVQPDYQLSVQNSTSQSEETADTFSEKPEEADARLRRMLNKIIDNVNQMNAYKESLYQPYNGYEWNTNAYDVPQTATNDYTVNTENLLGKPSSYFQNNNSTSGWSGNSGGMNDNQPLKTNPQEIHNRIFNGVDCGGMSPEFADKIAYLESRGNCRNNINDYGCVNNADSAFGRYQMQKPALIDAGYMDKNRKFIPETGIKNMQDFLNSPLAQEQAMCNYLDRIDQYNKNWNNYKYLGKNIQVGNLTIPITKDMMLAGTHREGARKLNEWLNDAKFQNNNLIREAIYDRQDEKKRNITRRFEEILNPPK